MVVISFFLALLISFNPIFSCMSNVFVNNSSNFIDMNFDILNEENRSIEKINIQGIIDISDRHYVNLNIDRNFTDEELEDYSFDIVLDNNSLYVSDIFIKNYIIDYQTKDPILVDTAINNALNHFNTNLFQLVNFDELYSENEDINILYNYFINMFIDSFKKAKAVPYEIKETDENISLNMDVNTVLDAFEILINYFDENRTVFTDTKNNIIEYVKQNSHVLDKMEYLDFDEFTYYMDVFEEDFNSDIDSAINFFEIENGKCETIKKDICIRRDENICIETKSNEYEDCTIGKNDIVKRFEDSFINVTILKTGDVSGVIKIIDNELNILNVRLNGVIKDSQEYRKKIVSNIKVEDFIDVFHREYNRLDPIDMIEIDLYEIDSNSVDILSYRAIDTEAFNISDFHSKTAYMIDGIVHLPMRFVVESFGEIVVWENDIKKAYVVRENEKIDMSGIICDGITYIPVNDFEKLGYQIFYEEDYFGSEIIYIDREKF